MALHVKTHRARATKADSKPSRTGSIASTSGAAGTPQKQTTSVKAAYTCRKTRAEAVAAGAAAAAGCGAAAAAAAAAGVEEGRPHSEAKAARMALRRSTSVRAAPVGV